MARTVRDCALLLNAMAGSDARDASTVSTPVPDFTADLEKGMQGIRLGVPLHHFGADLDPEVESAYLLAVKQFEELGARIEEIELPHASNLVAAHTIIVAVEAFGHHASLLRQRSADYGWRTKQRLALGAFFSAADYQKSLQIRTLWIRELNRAFENVDGIVTPTLPAPAYPASVQEARNPDEALRRSLETIDSAVPDGSDPWHSLNLSGPPDTSWGTRHFNLSGHPALSLPCGFTKTRLPIGLQIISRAFDEVTLFRIAQAFEQSTIWHTLRPQLEETRTS
jgi:aspartyl-tRNA(Asn)/glutamyl-tRNA(Gln) amidotransferase subunit A